MTDLDKLFTDDAVVEEVVEEDAVEKPELTDEGIEAFSGNEPEEEPVVLSKLQQLALDVETAKAGRNIDDMSPNDVYFEVVQKLRNYHEETKG